MSELKTYPIGFEEDHELRSSFVRQMMLNQVRRAHAPDVLDHSVDGALPRTLVRYWHEPRELPEDVRMCMASWDSLELGGYEIRTFCDATAAAYITRHYGAKERAAFERCRHPAMRSDFLRMCFVLEEGGLYVDADDVLVGSGYTQLFLDASLKLQPFCYDLGAQAMVPSSRVWQADMPSNRCVFYVNNNPIAAPAGHPVLRRALARATTRLLGRNPKPEIQSTTGPGNLTAALVAHVRDAAIAGVPSQVHLIPSWESVAETRWELSYRGDARNWRLMDCEDRQS